MCEQEPNLPRLRRGLVLYRAAEPIAQHIQRESTTVGQFTDEVDERPAEHSLLPGEVDADLTYPILIGVVEQDVAQELVEHVACHFRLGACLDVYEAPLHNKVGVCPAHIPAAVEFGVENGGPGEELSMEIVEPP